MKCKIKGGFRCDGQRCASCPKYAEGIEVGECAPGIEARRAILRKEAEPYTKVAAKQGRPLPETGADRRRAILKEVEACVCRDRQNTYGDAEDNFSDIALMCSIILARKLKVGVNLEAEDIAIIHACTKLARIKTSPDHLDNWVDLAGYGVCGAGIVKSRTA